MKICGLLLFIELLTYIFTAKTLVGQRYQIILISVNGGRTQPISETERLN